jgi:endo-1,4-beta-D-glucanase Y
MRVLSVLAITLGCLLAVPASSLALGRERYVELAASPGAFEVAAGGQTAALVVDSNDFSGVLRVAGDLRQDIQRVCGLAPELRVEAGVCQTRNPILVGTLGRNRWIDQLARAGKLEVNSIAGKWESYVIQVVSDPAPGIERALVIAGSDKRGTIFGAYDLSEQMGVSPWYWWADVPVAHRPALYVKAGRVAQGPPAVKYRGIFLNDEAPCLSGWSREKFGGLNHAVYTNVFELILRLKGNYLWPAMWDNSFATDDPLNARLADEYGIVMGTSHHEPMMRAWKEWERAGNRKGSWDYAKNSEKLREFWREGIRRTRDYEKVVTLGMRGDGDEPMSESESVALLERIVADQRQMLRESLNPDLAAVPQVWALYKEVQGYYEKGMRVPEDVTLLWCDDNWGNVRRLPTPEERRRPGGAGIYYHFDYVGGPRNYKWLNTVPIAKVWEQMTQAYEYGADRLWIVNVGDLKPLEFPIEFFMHLAWAPREWPRERLADYTRLWAEREFGAAFASQIADIVAKYTRFNGWRKPELLEPDTFSLVDYQEAERVMAGWREITSQAETIYQQLPAEARDAFFELVLYPAKASATVVELYIAAGRNRLYAAQGRASANELAAEARALFAQDAALARRYNEEVAGGKWRHIMDQTHIGYTGWQQPPSNAMPQVAELALPEAGAMGVAVEGQVSAWPGASNRLALPCLDSYQRPARYLDVFNRGRKTFTAAVQAAEPWVLVKPSVARIDLEQRFWVSVDWSRIPSGVTNAVIQVTEAGGGKVLVDCPLFNPSQPARDALEGFVETDGCVSMEAAHFTRRVDGTGARWEEIPGHGRTLSSMRVIPTTATSATPPHESACLEYRMYLFHPGVLEVEAMLAPSQNFVPGRGLRYGISFDDQPVRVVDMLEHNALRDWETTVKDGVRKSSTRHEVGGAGYHTLKFWMVDPGVAPQKLVVNLGGVKPSYFGPPESYRGVLASSEGVGAAETGRYRNLFVEAGHAPGDVKARLTAAFAQLFHGDPGSQAVNFSAGSNSNGPLAYILDVLHNDVRSEGMSYGMMIAVQMDRKAEFDAMWNWSRSRLFHGAREHPAYGYFAWCARTNGVAIDEMPAADGEQYFAMALYFASGRWGDGQGIFNYRAEADQLVSRLRHREPIAGTTGAGELTAGALFDERAGMVRFTPVAEHQNHTDPSYHLPAFYELWARWGPAEDRKFWANAARISRDFFPRAAHPETGLSPDYANFDGTPWAAPWSSGSVDFRCDAWRAVMNWSVDWAWWGRDERQRGLSDRLQAFFKSQGMGSYGNQFALDGRALDRGHSAGLVAMNAVASLAATRPAAAGFVDELWELPVPSGYGRYYDGMLYLLAMLHCGGEFRVWQPADQVVGAAGSRAFPGL